MRVEFARVEEGPVSWNEELVVDRLRLDRAEVQALTPVSWQGEISYAEPGYLLRGEIVYEQTLGCFRCLEPLVEPVRSSLELLILPQADSAANEEGQLEEGDLNVVYCSGKELDTEPLVLEQLQLNVPMKPLCSPDCRGLCPSCGAELNRLGTGDCQCREESIDPRWGALEALRERLHSGS